MSTRSGTKSYRPGPFCPFTSYTGEEDPIIIKGENMWVRYSRYGSAYAEGYTGNKDLNETIATKTLTGTLAWDFTTKTVTGTGTLFTTEIDLGDMVLGNGGATATELFVVTKVVDDTHFIAEREPTTTLNTKPGYVMPVIYAVGTERGTSIRGNVVKFTKGNFLGVGDGEFKLNGASLAAPFNLSKIPRLALRNQTSGAYIQKDVGLTTPATLPTVTAVAGTSPMRAGAFSIRITANSTQTLGYSNPTDPTTPVTITDGQQLHIVFNDAMPTNQDSYDIYSNLYQSNSTAGIEARYMGPWYWVKTITAAMLIDGGHPTGREAGTSYTFSFSDAEISVSDGLLSFDNFAPKKAKFCDVINGIPIFFSCLGPGNATDTDGTSPGPAAIPAKPSNPEAVFLDKAVTTSSGDTILGEFNAKGRIFVLCQNSLQTIVLTTVDSEPIAFRSLWNSGFRNPYNVAFVKEYLYGFSTIQLLRSVAGGDDTAVEFEYASDVANYVSAWKTGHVLVAHDPKNRAVIHFYTAAERRSGYWVTIALPFSLDKGVWNPPIILKRANQDFIVSGVATVGQELCFLAGGRKSDGSISVGSYVFDGGDTEAKDWYLAWNYADDGEEFIPKTVKGRSYTGRFDTTNGLTLQVHGVKGDGIFDFTGLAAGTGYENTQTAVPATADIIRKRLASMEAGPFSVYTIRASGSYTAVPDRLDEIVLKLTGNNSDL